MRLVLELPNACSCHCFARPAPIGDVFKILLKLLLLFVISLWSGVAVAQAPDAVPNSYIITFRQDAGATKSPILRAVRRATPPAFGEHSSGQDKRQLAAALGIRGAVRHIYDATNAANLVLDDEDLYKLSRDPRVLAIDKDLVLHLSGVQNNPGWALDRLDQPTVALNEQYQYGATGAGQSIYILDSGLTLSNPAVAAEFEGRASIFFDINTGGDGRDCYWPGHGSMVASAAAGKTYGVAKGATLKIVKITQGCTGSGYESDWMAAFNWLATNAPRGTIVSLSANPNTYACQPTSNSALDASIKSAHDNGIIVVISAGNDGCDTANQVMVNSPYAFVVGATTMAQFNSGLGFDAKASFSRYGSNVSAYAPGERVVLMDKSGQAYTDDGTSFSAPYIAGMFAIACQKYGGCNTMSNASVAYDGLRSFGADIVMTLDGRYLLPGKGGRFISKPDSWNH